MIDLKKLLQEAPTGVEWAGLREVREEEICIRARDGSPDHHHRRHNYGVFCELLVNGQYAYAATSELSSSTVRAAFERAHRLADKAAPFGVFKFTPKVRPPSVGRYCSPGSSGVSLPTNELWELAINTSLAAKVSPRIVSSAAVFILNDCTIRICSTSGADIEQLFHFISPDISAVASERGEVQRRSDAGHMALSSQGGKELFNDHSKYLDRAIRVGTQAEELVLAPECEEGVFDLVLAPDQMILQIHESIGHPLEMDRILADERNFAGWSFVRREDFGTLQYGSKDLNITYDPSIPEQFASFGFDDHGEPASKEYLIKDGLLVRGLGGLESQTRLGIPGVACTRASGWNRAPVDRMANLNLEPGTSSMSEMLEALDRGVYMESNCSWSIDDYRRKFQFGCEYGRIIKSGKLGHVVRNPNYRGVTLPFWRSLAMLGNKDTFQVLGIPSCGKGEPQQTMRVGHASPSALFRNVEIFGGAKK